MLENNNIRVLVTGCAGFIGAHLVDALLHQTDWEIIGLDSFRGKGSYSRLDDIPDMTAEMGTGFRFQVYHHDLSVPLDQVLINRIGPINSIFSIASNSAVERSISNPVDCWRNNCELILNTLEYARTQIGLQRFIHLSTDEVYGDYVSSGNGYPEWSIINPSNPYAASKAAQEALAIAYWRTYDMPIVLVNTMNNIGEWQDQEKFVPKVIAHLVQKQPIKIYTDNEGNIGSRVYLDAKDHARFLIALLKRQPQRYSDGYPQFLDRWNIAGLEEKNNLEMVQLIAELMGIPFSTTSNQCQMVRAESARPGYDKRYLLDSNKFQKYIVNFTDVAPHTLLSTTLQRIIQHVTEKTWWLT